MAINTRRYQRFPIFAKAIVRLRSGMGVPPMESQITNINQGGMGMYIDTPLRNSTPVSIELSFTASDGSGITNVMDGKVVSLSRGANIYFMGVSFDRELSYENIMNLIYGDQ